jgi:hypothetical protein
MLKRYRGAAVAAVVALFASAGLVNAAGLWDNFVQIGQSSFCATYATTAAGQACVQFVPAGPATFSGNEYSAYDLNQQGTTGVTAGGAQTASVGIVQLGQGPMIDLTTVGTAQTIPNNTPFYFLDGAQGSALTVTMPAVAIEGQIQRVVCEAATVGVLTVAANTNQTLKGNPNAACTAGVGYAWRYQASNTTWYRFQ